MIDPVATTRPPASALLLGYAGLLPPIITIAMWLFDLSFLGAPAPFLTLVYAALILTFIGGMWWGVAVTRVAGTALAFWLAMAVVPSLVALVSMIFSRSYTSCAAILVAGLLGSLLVDMALVRAGYVPVWWMRLRVPLSVGLAVLTLVAGLLAAGR